MTNGISVYPLICSIFKIFVFFHFPSKYILTYFKIIVVVTFKIMLYLNKIHIQDTDVRFYCCISADKAQ
jgi:hypothetical protein